jgi:hypothetical protein
MASRKKLFAALAWGLAVLSAQTHATEVTVTADLQASSVAQSFAMLECVGASHGEMFMWEENRNHLRAIARDIGFSHIRGHGLLNDDLSTFLNGEVSGLRSLRRAMLKYVRED